MPATWISNRDLNGRITAGQFLSSSLALIERIRNGKYVTSPISQIGKVRGGKRLPPNSRYVLDGIPYVRSTDIHDLRVDFSQVVKISTEHQQIIANYPLEYEDVVIGIAGTIGTIGLVDEKVGLCHFNENLARITDIQINPAYLAIYLHSKFGQAYIDYLKGGAVQPKLSLVNINRIQVPVLPREMQDHVAEIMQAAYAARRGKLDEAERLTKKVSNLVLDELAISIAHFVDEKRFLVDISKLTGNRFDLNLYNTRYTGLMKQLRELFGDKLVTLRSLSHPITSGSTPLGSKYVKDGVPFLRVQNIRDDGTVDLSDLLYVSDEFARTIERAAIQDGDLLLVIVGATIGKSAVVNGISSFTVPNQAIARIRLKEGAPISIDFLQAFLNSLAGQIQIAALKRPVAQGNLNLTETGLILIPIVPVETQQKIIHAILRQRAESKRLRMEADQLVLEAKAKVERMILGEETA